MLFISDGIMDAFVKEFDVEEEWMARGWRMVEKLSGVVKNTWAGFLERVREGSLGEGGEIVRLRLFQGALFWWRGRMCLGLMMGF